MAKVLSNVGQVSLPPLLSRLLLGECHIWVGQPSSTWSFLNLLYRYIALTSCVTHGYWTQWEAGWRKCKAHIVNTDLDSGMQTEQFSQGTKRSRKCKIVFQCSKICTLLKYKSTGNNKPFYLVSYICVTYGPADILSRESDIQYSTWDCWFKYTWSQRGP